MEFCKAGDQKACWQKASVQQKTDFEGLRTNSCSVRKPCNQNLSFQSAGHHKVQFLECFKKRKSTVKTGGVENL